MIKKQKLFSDMEKKFSKGIIKPLESPYEVCVFKRAYNTLNFKSKTTVVCENVKNLFKKYGYFTKDIDGYFEISVFPFSDCSF